MRIKFLPLFVIALCLLSLPLLAQEVAEPTAEINWPPPVYVLRGEASLRGTVNLADMTGYFIEYRALDEDLSAPEARPWLPITLPSSIPVVDDVLGTWDTRRVTDGLYELRLNVIVSGAEMLHRTLGPLRVENAMAAAPEMEAEEVAAVTETMVDETTPVPDETPRVTARVNANVRAGDSTSFRAIDALLTGESAPILGVSSRGTAWYQIALPNGRRGWISEIVVIVSGNTDNLPRIVPPRVPIRPTAIPVHPPATQPDLVVEEIHFDDDPECDDSFEVRARVANLGQVASTASGSIDVRDWHIASGTPNTSTIGGFPPLAPGERFWAFMPLTVNTYFREGHRVIVTVDTTNTVAESNEGNNSNNREYVLEKGDC
jgi:uncharacterized protein YraI